MADAGEIKFRVSGEYDPSAIKAAKEDIASLQSAAGALGGSGSAVSDATIAAEALGENITKAASGISAFRDTAIPMVDAAKNIPPVLEQTASSLDQARQSAQDAQQALAPVQETLQNTIGPAQNANVQIERMGTAMPLIAGPAQDVAQGYKSLNEAVVQAQPALEQQSVIYLPQSASALSAVDAQVQTLSDTYGGFTDGLGAANRSLNNLGPSIYEQLGIPEGTALQFDKSGRIIGEAGRLAQENLNAATASANDATTAFDNLGTAGSAAQSKLGGAGSTLFTNEIPINATGEAVASNTITMAEYKKAMAEAEGGTSSFGETIAGLEGGLWRVMMPMMMIQFGSQFIGQMAQGLYDAAAVAEGPAAHAFGTFTGTVDALGQSMQANTNTFAESFGKVMQPSLAAMADTTQKSGTDFWGGVGSFLGGVTGFTLDAGQLLGGALLSAVGIKNTWLQTGVEGFSNSWAAMNGQPLPYPGPEPLTPTQQAWQQMPGTLLTSRGNLEKQTAQLMGQAADPGYLADYNQYQAAQQIYQQQQTIYDQQHPVDKGQMLADARYNLYVADQTAQYQQQLKQQQTSGPNQFEGFMQGAGNIVQTWANLTGLGQPVSLAESAFKGIWSLGSWIGGLLGGGTATGASADFGGGCFPEGTPILLSDGATKPIERIIIGDLVKTHEGISNVTTTFSFENKHVYSLSFADGSSLRLTDSHPVATQDGWKSISPRQTAKESPDLLVHMLNPGDSVFTKDGSQKRIIRITLEQGKQRVYNITVAKHHTYYAKGFLVHNMAKTMSTVSDASGGEMTHTFQAKVNWVADDLEHTFLGKPMWDAVGELAHTFLGAPMWDAIGELAHTFLGDPSWDAVGELAHTFMGSPFWDVMGELAHMFMGQPAWDTAGDLMHTFTGIADWIGNNLNNTFIGEASWDGKNLDHTFIGTASWDATNLNPTFNVSPNFTGLPAFAEGVQGYSGLAIVGEKGPELVSLSGGSVFPLTDMGGGGGVSPLSLGGGGPQSINLSVNLDSMQLISAMGMPIASAIRVGMGMRAA